jgi:hypothetical protein
MIGRVVRSNELIRMDKKLKGCVRTDKTDMVSNRGE